MAIVDAGSKTLAGDVEAGAVGVRSYGEVQGGGGRIAWLNEEHGAVQLKPGYEPAVGDRLRIVPVHACTVVNLADELVLNDGDRVVRAVGRCGKGVQSMTQRARVSAAGPSCFLAQFTTTCDKKGVTTYER